MFSPMHNSELSTTLFCHRRICVAWLGKANHYLFSCFLNNLKNSLILCCSRTQVVKTLSLKRPLTEKFLTGTILYQFLSITSNKLTNTEAKISLMFLKLIYTYQKAIWLKLMIRQIHVLVWKRHAIQIQLRLLSPMIVINKMMD